MVQHNDKWKKKASRDYHRKHGTLSVGRGRGRGRVDDPRIGEQLVDDQNNESTADDSDSELDDDVETENQKGRSKYSRRQIHSNAWRFESEEPDPYLGMDIQLQT